jgi:predicted NBD/HSP70 family sugar kinase
MSDPLPWLDRAVRYFDDTRRPVVVAGLIAFGAGFLLLLKWGPGGVTGWVAVVFLLIAVLVVLVLAFSVLRAVLVQPAVRLVDAGKVTGGRVVIGIHAARTGIDFGMLEIPGDTGLPLGGLKTKELISRQVRPWSGMGREAIYSDITDAVTGMVEAHQGMEIDAVVIALPGLVYVGRRSLQTSAGGLPPNSLVAEEVAQRLVNASPAVVKAFRRPEDATALAQRIFVDNDARSLGRYLLNRQPADWRNYACLLVSDGVGSALVFDQRLYYGSYCASGEAGHQTLQLSANSVISALRRDQGLGSELRVPDCRCRKTGLHFEMVANDSGVSRLARAIGPETYGRLAESLKREPGDLLPIGVLLELGAISLGHSVPGNRFDKTLVGKLDDDEHREFFSRLVDEYARLLTIGLANLVNVLDLDNVVLTGPVVGAFDTIDGFSQALQKYRAAYILREDRVGLKIDPRLASWIWAGAALAIRDPEYGRLVAESGK